MKKKYVPYNGPKISQERLDRIKYAQTITTYSIGGKQFEQIRYGDEFDDYGANEHPCEDCMVVKGQLYVPTCSIESCPSCLGQATSCDCDYDEIERHL